MKKKRQGFTLTELAIAMMLIGLFLAAVWAAAVGVWAGSRVEKGVNETWQIATNYRSLYTGMTLSSLPTTDDLVSAGVFPSSMLRTVSGKKTPYDAWGGTATITFPTSSIKKFRMTFNGVKNTECVSFLTSIPPTGQDGSPSDAYFSTNGSLSSSLVDKTPTEISTAVQSAHGCTAVVFDFSL